MLALGLSEAAYMAEIVRAGIQSIDPGQSEAAVALGLSRSQVLRRVVLPQAMRVIVPPTGNEVIAMVKDTSLVAFVPVTGELFFQLQAIEARTFVVLPVLVAAVLWYLILCSVLMVAQFFVERHFSRGYGTTGRARQRLRDIEVEQGGRIAAEGGGHDGGPRWFARTTCTSRSGRLEVLKGIDLVVEPGEVCCVLGPSGSGKSTFLRCINHLEKINAGRIFVDGDLVGYRRARRQAARVEGQGGRRAAPGRSAWCSSGSTCSRT